MRSTDAGHFDEGPLAAWHVTDDAQPDQLVAVKCQGCAIGLVPVNREASLAVLVEAEEFSAARDVGGALLVQLVHPVA